MRPGEIEPVKLVVSVLSSEMDAMEKAIGAIKKRFGETDFRSDVLDFNYTDYYEPEMGKGLKRFLLAFERLVPPGELSGIKTFTNGIEDCFLASGGGRRVNIDPGYLTLEKLVLASCKNFSHRIYLDKGVYAEITLVYKNKDFRPLEWTYPDYKDAPLLEMLREIRRIYAKNIGRGA